MRNEMSQEMGVYVHDRNRDAMRIKTMPGKQKR